MIDDTPAWLEGARQIGMHAIVFKDMEQLMEDLRALGYSF
jgi:FMN phosphatase YigB (HAD superfamily)